MYVTTAYKYMATIHYTMHQLGPPIVTVPWRNKCLYYNAKQLTLCTLLTHFDS